MDGGRLELDDLVVVHRGRAMVALERWLQEHHHIDGRHLHRLNYYLGIVLVMFMAVSVVALVCCCYHLEWRLRLQSRNSAGGVNPASGSVGQTACSDEMSEIKVVKQETSLSVLMPGDSIPSFLAKAKPHGSVTGVPVFSAAGGKDASRILFI